MTISVPECILDDDVLASSNGGVHRYLVRWKDRPVCDATWVTADEMARLDEDMLHRYRLDHSPVTSGFERGRIDGGDPVPPDDAPRGYNLRPNTRKSYRAMLRNL
ncbi:hypothetical protein KSP40_PGU006291 [Platanthera guangdongensis]|uniref:Chromo domain-containing protein n=1 Tax=Platanthera guangdongensis TaxID=2320717 RepID=A0ABR2M2W4_9ASPA